MRTIKAKMAGPPTARNDGAGITHNVWVAFLDAEGNDVNEGHTVFPIPNARFAELLEPMSDPARVALDKALIMEFYGAGATEALRPRRACIGVESNSSSVLRSPGITVLVKFDFLGR